MLRFPTRPRPGSLTEFLASDQVRQQLRDHLRLDARRRRAWVAGAARVSRFKRRVEVRVPYRTLVRPNKARPLTARVVGGDERTGNYGLWPTMLPAPV